jgi:hypothetical protein
MFGWKFFLDIALWTNVFVVFGAIFQTDYEYHWTVPALTLAYVVMALWLHRRQHGGNNVG